MEDRDDLEDQKELDLEESDELEEDLKGLDDLRDHCRVYRSREFFNTDH